MPTPSPSIVASTGVIVLKFVSAAASVSSERPTPTDSSAITIGSPAATAPPSMKRRITTAASSPSSSLVPVSGSCEPWITGPVNSTCTPVPSVAARRSTWRRSIDSPGMSNTGREYWTSAKAMRPSSLSAPARPAKGSPTLSTPGMAAASSSAAVTAERAPPSSSLPPSGAANTTWAASPDCCGKRSSSRSTARWASESGMVNSSTSVPPTVALPATMAAMATTQATTVRQRWRAQARASRARAPSWLRRGVGGGASTDMGTPKGRTEGRGGAAAAAHRATPPYAVRQRDGKRRTPARERRTAGAMTAPSGARPTRRQARGRAATAMPSPGSPRPATGSARARVAVGLRAPPRASPRGAGRGPPGRRPACR